MKRKILLLVLALLLIIGAVLAHYAYDPWGFYWKVPENETQLRLEVVRTAEGYFGCKESDGSHKEIIDLYNGQDVLPVGYTVQYTDSWCSTFVSAVAIRCGITDILPTECGCERHIALFQALGCWDEQDNATPQPGDLIFYDWDETGKGDCTGWSDHVGIVVGIKWPFIKVIEGNRDDQVMYRILPINDVSIRGYAKPDYASLSLK